MYLGSCMGFLAVFLVHYQCPRGVPPSDHNVNNGFGLCNPQTEMKVMSKHSRYCFPLLCFDNDGRLELDGALVHL